MRRRVALLLALVLGTSARADDYHRFALIVGERDGGVGSEPLRYAERDAQRIHGILTKLGGVREEDAILLLSAGAATFRSSLLELLERSRRAQAQGEPTLVVVYYSGHSRDGELRLGGGRIAVEELRRELQQAPADVRIALVDSCQSGAIARPKGVRPVPEFSVTQGHPAGPRGMVLIGSSAANEDSQESDSIGASFFTHYLASGLLGDADSSGDGKVTLGEAYEYAYTRTVGSTVESAGGVQHPVYLYDLGGSGDVVLTELVRHSGGLVFPAALEGSYVILDRAHRAIAEVAKAAGGERQLALPPGRYTVKKRLAGDGGLLVADYRIGAAREQVDEAAMRRIPLARDPQKGFSGPRWSLAAGAGYQSFFAADVRRELFPSLVMGGAELRVRGGRLGRLGLALDVATGTGRGRAPLGEGETVRFQTTEVTGGASLFRDFRLGKLEVSPGVRLGLVYLTRSFSEDALSSQSYTSATPGLFVSAAYRFTPAFSAMARARAQYLYYDVDGVRNLAFADATLGIEYAFGD